jgi:hypothetical protein
MTLNCPTCKAELTGDARFCPRCGAQFPGGPPPLRTEPASRPSAESAWLEGKDLVIRQSAPDLPATCIKCGRPANHRIKSKLYWHSPWAYVAILLNILVYAIIALIVRKVITLEVPICDEHRSQRRRFLWLGGASLVAGAVAPIALLSADQGAFAAVAVLVFVVVAFVFFAKARLLTPRYIDAEVAKVRGPCDSFLQQFPRRAA